MRSLVYLSPVPWHSVAQRPHKFAEWFHCTQGGRVLWLDPYPSRLPQASDLRRLRGGMGEPGPAVPPWLRLARVPALPLEPLPGLAHLNRLMWQPVLAQVREQLAAAQCDLVIGKPSRLAAMLLRTLRPAVSIYDGMDDFPAFHGGMAGRAMAAMERLIVEQVDVVYASAGKLQEKFCDLGCATVLVRNACDPASLPSLTQVQALREPNLVGYVGTLASWFDWDMVARLAQARTDLRFRLIGPRHVDVPPALPANVEILPPCEHQHAMREMARFSAGLIPFVRNTLTDSVDPVKYYEYRALGIPVLSSAFGEMAAHAREDAGVLLLEAGFDPVDALQRAFAWTEPAGGIDSFRQANAWATRFSAAQVARDTARCRR